MYWIGMIITAVLLVGYCALILVYRHLFLRLPLFMPGQGLNPSNTFTIVIPARNEENTIEHCLRSVLEQSYPQSLYEVIVVNDHSTDGTERIILSLQQQYANLHLINLADHLEGKRVNAYKKKAI